MDLASTIIGISLLLLFVVPVILLNRRRKNKEKIFKQKLFSMAENESCTIQEFETWNNTGIGYDQNSSKVFFVKKIAYKEIKDDIDLKEAISCQLLNTNHSVNTNDGVKLIVEKLELIFTLKNNKEKTLLMYDNDFDNSDLDGEVQIANKWQSKFTKELESLQSKN